MLAAPALEQTDDDQDRERNRQQHHGDRRSGHDVVVLDLAVDAHGGHLRLERDVAGDQHHRAELPDRPRKPQPGASQDGRHQVGQHDQAKGRPAAGAQRGGRLLHLAVHLPQHRLHAAHHKGERDEEQRQHHRDPGVGHIDAQRAAHPVHGDQGQPGHDRRQGEGQIDQGADHILAREGIAHQHPGDQRAHHRVHRGDQQRGAQAELQRGHRLRRRHRGPEPIPPLIASSGRRPRPAG